MEDILPTNNCPADPEDQEEEELLQIQGQNLIGLPNEEIANFSLQCDPQAQVDANFEAMQEAHRHQDAEPAPEGLRTPSPSAEEGEESDGFMSSPSRVPSDDYQESPEKPETAFDHQFDGSEQADGREDYAEEAHFWEEQEQQYQPDPEWTPWTEENHEYFDQGPAPARNSSSYAQDRQYPDTPDPRVPNPTDKSAGRLIRSTQRLYHRHSAVIQVPIYILNATIDVQQTDPLFYKHQKFPSTVQQAVVALYRIASYRDAMDLMVKASGWNGRRLQDEFDKFLAVIGLGQGLSIPLTVGVTILTLCGSKAAPKYTTIQDVTQAWLLCTTPRLSWLLDQLKTGNTPTELTPDDEIEDSCPGLVRLRHPDPAQRENWYTHYYMCVYSACCYTADSELNSLRVIAYWKKVADYRQKRGEELVNVISRERQRFTPVVKVCRQLGIECVKTPDRILNMQGLVLEDLFKSAEARALYFGTEFAEATWQEFIKCLLAEEVRMKKLTVQQRGELTGSQKKTWEKQADRPRTDRTDRKKEYGNKKYAPRAAPAASGTGTCPNHPESDHTAPSRPIPPPPGMVPF